jgi:cobalt-zinc-cadmium efflux system membrane fusion protein
MEFTVLAYPNTVFKATIDHVAASLDPSIRRLMVRAMIDNTESRFKPEMFTSVTIYSDQGETSVAVPREAVIYQADTARVWVARPDKTVEVRQIKTGITRAGLVQVVQGLQAGESVVTKGSLFVDQAAGS